MSLFGKKKELPPLMTEADFEDVASFSSAVAYLEGLSDEDYVKVLEVGGIRRKAIKDCAAVLGQPSEPTTYIDPPKPADEPNFLEDELKPNKPKSIKVQ